MALQTFTAGQVLTAAQVNNLQANDYNQTVSTKTDSYTLVAADKGTRVVMNKATATTITVNTSLFNAGDTLWIHNVGAGVCTITAGTATVSTSGSLALAQNAGGTLYFTSAGVAIFFPTVASSAQGLTLLNTTSFSAVASQSVNSVFSSTYANYLVLMNMTTSTTMTPQFRFRTASDDTTSNYNIQHLEASVSTVTATRNLNTNIMGLTPTTFNGKLVYSMQFLSPNQAVETQGFISTSIYMNSITSAFYQNTSDQYTGFTVIASTGTISGTLRVFGYNN